ncbi:MAG: hypothetical protein ACTSRL_10620 [Candidatus Helarchaeota archaeon]
MPEDVVQERVLNLLEKGFTFVFPSQWWLGTSIADYRVLLTLSFSTRMATNLSTVKSKLVLDEASSKNIG